MDMNFIFSWSTRYLTRSLRSLVIKFISTRGHVISSIYCFIFRPVVVTMSRTLLTVVAILLVAGVFVEQGRALLRAGRNKIEGMQRNPQLQQRETVETVEVPYCIMPGNNIWTPEKFRLVWVYCPSQVWNKRSARFQRPGDAIQIIIHHPPYSAVCIAITHLLKS